MAGPGVGGGGGGIMISQDSNTIVIDMDNIIDIRTHNDTIINAGDIWKNYNQVQGFKPIKNTYQVAIDFSENSDVSDVQLADGSIIDKWELPNYTGKFPAMSLGGDGSGGGKMIMNGGDTSGGGKFVNGTDSGGGRLNPEESQRLIMDLGRVMLQNPALDQSLVNKAEFILSN